MFKKVILLFISSHLIVLFLQSCLVCENKGKIVGLDSTLVVSTNYNPMTYDEVTESYLITEPFRCLIQTENIRYAALNNNFNAAYATSQCMIETWDNDLNSNSFKVYFDHEFSYLQTTIRDSTNIHFLIHSNLSNEGQGIHEAFGLEFDSAFIENSLFDTSLIYTLHYSGFTTDSILIADSIRLSFKLN